MAKEPLNWIAQNFPETISPASSWYPFLGFIFPLHRCSTLFWISEGHYFEDQKNVWNYQHKGRFQILALHFLIATISIKIKCKMSGSFILPYWEIWEVWFIHSLEIKIAWEVWVIDSLELQIALMDVIISSIQCTLCDGPLNTQHIFCWSKRSVSSNWLPQPKRKCSPFFFQFSRLPFCGLSCSPAF